MQLEYFITAAERGSFSQAAEQLYISQPAISKQIHLLEEEWGVKLFSRKYHSISLTEAGELMLEHAKLSKISLQNALYRAKQIEHTPGKKFFSIGLFEHGNLRNLNRVLKEFSIANPGVSFSLENNNFFTPNEGLKTQKFDLIFILKNMLMNEFTVEEKPLFNARFIAYLSSGHPLASKPDLKFPDLSEECFYIPTPRNSSLTYNTCLNICLSNGFSIRDYRFVPNVETAVLAVRMGSGTVMLDDQVVIQQADDLIAVPTDTYTPVVMAWLKNSGNPLIPPVVQNILDVYTLL